MWTIYFQIIIAVVIMILTIIKLVHKLLITGQLSDKYYKYIALVAVGVAIYVSYFSSLFIGFESTSMVESLKSAKLSLDTAQGLSIILIENLNLQSIYLIIGILLYGIFLYILKSISKDIEAQVKIPKDSWGDFIEKSTKN